MKYKILDLETQTHVYKKRKASRWHPKNYIVAAGWKNRGDEKCSYQYWNEHGTHHVKIEEDVMLIIGFNLKFDLLWQWDNPDLIAFFKRGGRIWDCQYVEYLLSGQDPKYHYCSLDQIVEKYGGRKKIDEVKLLWEAGVQTSDINKDLIIDYLIGTEEEERNSGDIGNTELIFLGQLKRAKEVGMIKALWSRMDGLCAIIEMEWNGLQIDKEESKKQYKILSAKHREAEKFLDENIPELPEGLEFNWGSPTHKSCLIYGGCIKYQRRDTYIDEKTGELARLKAYQKFYIKENGEVSDVPAPDDHDDLPVPEGMLTFKSGKKAGLAKTKKVEVQGELKRKYQDFYFTLPGHITPRAEWANKTKDGAGNPLYSTAGDIIEALSGSGIPFLEALSEYEALSKEIGTYFFKVDPKTGEKKGMLTCVIPATHKIHHSLNNVATVTGRLSSSEPNLQNIPRADKSKIKRLFISRYDGGYTIEADYSQLEVVVQGVLTGDKNLIRDLNDNIDFHCKRVAMQPKYNITYDELVEIIKNEDHPDHKKWKKIRTQAKIFSFQRAYGAGASLIALSTGMDIDDVKTLIAAEEKTYPGVTIFNEAVEQAAIESSKKFFDPVAHKMYKRGYWQAPTGCLYSFRTYDAPDWLQDRGITENFSPTEIKNYPVQGTGGEIVQGICGKLWRHFVANENYGGKAVLCNTVHDCIWADAHPDVKDEVCKDIKEIMESVPEWFAQFNVTINVPFPVEVEAGPNMLDLKHVA